MLCGIQAYHVRKDCHLCRSADWRRTMALFEFSRLFTVVGCCKCVLARSKNGANFTVETSMSTGVHKPRMRLEMVLVKIAYLVSFGSAAWFEIKWLCCITDRPKCVSLYVKHFEVIRFCWRQNRSYIVRINLSYCSIPAFRLGRQRRRKYSPRRSILVVRRRWPTKRQRWSRSNHISGCVCGCIC